MTETLSSLNLQKWSISHLLRLNMTLYMTADSRARNRLSLGQWNTKFSTVKDPFTVCTDVLQTKPPHHHSVINAPQLMYHCLSHTKTTLDLHALLCVLVLVNLVIKLDIC